MTRPEAITEALRLLALVQRRTPARPQPRSPTLGTGPLGCNPPSPEDPVPDPIIITNAQVAALLTALARELTVWADELDHEPACDAYQGRRRALINIVNAIGSLPDDDAQATADTLRDQLRRGNVDDTECGHCTRRYDPAGCGPCPHC